MGQENNSCVVVCLLVGNNSFFMILRLPLLMMRSEWKCEGGRTPRVDGWMSLLAATRINKDLVPLNANLPIATPHRSKTSRY